MQFWEFEFVARIPIFYTTDLTGNGLLKCKTMPYCDTMRQTQSIIITLSCLVEVSRIETSVQAAAEVPLEHEWDATRFEPVFFSLRVIREFKIEERRRREAWPEVRITIWSSLHMTKMSTLALVRALLFFTDVIPRCSALLVKREYFDGLYCFFLYFC